MSTQTEPTPGDLFLFGYAPGRYMGMCRDCGKIEMDTAKRAWRCKECATTRWRKKQEAKEDASTQTEQRPLTADDIRAIREYTDAASAGPWTGYKSGYCMGDVCRVSPVFTDHGGMRRRDAVFVTRSRTDVPRLLDEIERLRAELDRAREEAQRTQAHMDILVDALSEIKATSDGESSQPISDILKGCLEEIKRLPPLPAQESQED